MLQVPCSMRRTQYMAYHVTRWTGFRSVVIDVIGLSLKLCKCQEDPLDKKCAGSTHVAH